MIATIKQQQQKKKNQNIFAKEQEEIGLETLKAREAQSVLFF